MKSKVSEIFKVEYEAKLYEAQEFSKYCEENGLLVEVEIKKCDIIYNDEKYSFEEYQKKLIANAKKFKKDEVDIQYMLIPEFVFAYDEKLYMCLKYLKTLCSIITAGNHYAIQSYNKIPTELYGIDSYAGYFYKRCMDFSTAILWYNSTIASFFQIFCSKFDFYKNINDKNIDLTNYAEKEKLCGYNKINNALKKIDKNVENSDMFNWWEKIDYCCKKMAWIKDCANSLKHRSGVEYEEIDLPLEIYKENLKMSEMYLPKRIDIDNDYDKIIEIHNEIIDVYTFMVKEINLQIEKIQKRDA